jgi:hypothetical protein
VDAVAVVRAAVRAVVAVAVVKAAAAAVATAAVTVVAAVAVERRRPAKVRISSRTSSRSIVLPRS